MIEIIKLSLIAATAIIGTVSDCDIGDWFDSDNPEKKKNTVEIQERETPLSASRHLTTDTLSKAQLIKIWAERIEKIHYDKRLNPFNFKGTTQMAMEDFVMGAYRIKYNTDKYCSLFLNSPGISHDKISTKLHALGNFIKDWNDDSEGFIKMLDTNLGGNEEIISTMNNGRTKTIEYVKEKTKFWVNEIKKSQVIQPQPIVQSTAGYNKYINYTPTNIPEPHLSFFGFASKHIKEIVGIILLLIVIKILGNSFRFIFSKKSRT